MSGALEQDLRGLFGPRLGLAGARPRVEPASERELVHLLELLARHGAALDAVELSRTRFQVVGLVEETSGLIEAGAGVCLGDLEEGVAHRGFSLGPLSPAILRGTVADFLEGPLAGGRPVRGGRLEPIAIAITALLPNGRRYQSLSSPRSAAGPDLDGLFLGGGARAGLVLGATLRLDTRPTRSRSIGVSAPSASALGRALRRALLDGARLARARVWEREGATLAEVRVTGSPETVERDGRTLLARVSGEGGAEVASRFDEQLPARAAERELAWESLAAALREAGTLQLHRLSVETVLVEGAGSRTDPLPAEPACTARIFAGIDPSGLLRGRP